MQPISIHDLVKRIENEMQGARIIIAIAGPPGVGKSTIADYLCHEFNKNHANICAILPMDGYHYDDIYLEEMGWRERKGAPHTFDVGGYAHILQRLKENSEPEIAVPVFDRSLEIARAGARLIPSSAKIILTEGNYLLLADKPWNMLHALFDHTIMLTAPKDVIKQRLHDRWVTHQLPADEIAQKMQENDLPNVEKVLNGSLTAEFEIATYDTDH